MAKDIVHDAEYYVPKAQNGERWAEADKGLDKKLADLKKKHGSTPNIVYILWDDQQVGAVGNEMIQKALGYTTPNINTMGRFRPFKAAGLSVPVRPLYAKERNKAIQIHLWQLTTQLGIS